MVREGRERLTQLPPKEEIADFNAAYGLWRKLSDQTSRFPSGASLHREDLPHFFRLPPVGFQWHLLHFSLSASRQFSSWSSSGTFGADTQNDRRRQFMDGSFLVENSVMGRPSEGVCFHDRSRRSRERQSDRSQPSRVRIVPARFLQRRFPAEMCRRRAFGSKRRRQITVMFHVVVRIRQGLRFRSSWSWYSYDVTPSAPCKCTLKVSRRRLTSTSSLWTTRRS